MVAPSPSYAALNRRSVSTSAFNAATSARRRSVCRDGLHPIVIDLIGGMEKGWKVRLLKQMVFGKRVKAVV